MSNNKEKKEDLFGFDNDSEEENDNSSVDEEEQEDSRFSKANLQKQALSDDESDDDDEEASPEQEASDDEEQDNDEEDENVADSVNEEEGDMESDVGYDEPKDLSAFGEAKKSRKSKKIKSLTPEELEKFEKARKRTGVCYLSRIPPFMKPSRVRSLLEKYAEIGRIYLVPEDPKITARRKKYKKERRTNFIEGWVEFKDKKKAKSLAEYLNMREIGGKRTNEYYHEMWNIKYLPKFKWHHFTEHMAYEKQARQQRLRNELAQSTRENKTYIQNVERAKMLQNMEQKKRKRGEDDNNSSVSSVKRTFDQRAKVVREVNPQQSGKKALDKLDNNLKGVLGSIFSKK